MPTTSRWALPYPAGSDSPDGPAQIQALAEALDNHAQHTSGTFAARPTSTGGNPGKAGRFYYATDTGVLYLDHGTGWIEVARATQPQVRLGLTNQTVANATETALTWQTEHFDTDTMHTASGQRITITTAGLYHVGYMVSWNDGNTTGYRQAEILHYNAADALQQHLAVSFIEDFGAVGVVQHGASIQRCAAGDYIVVSVLQNSGGSRQIGGLSEFWAARLGP